VELRIASAWSAIHHFLSISKMAGKTKATRSQTRCSTCKAVFSTKYTLQRHKVKKNPCGPKAEREREEQRKARRKMKNQVYYMHKKWGINKKTMSVVEVLDILLSKIPTHLPE
jgi:hypothetical protein